MYCYVWEFLVRPEKVRDFEKIYGPEGEWARLFRRDTAYLRTLLLRDRHAETRFLTVDFWQTRRACEDFRERFGDELAALDASCEALTLREIHVGDFDIAP